MGKKANSKRVYKDAPFARRNGVAALAAAEDKEPWACSVCFPKFAAQGKQDKYHFISGSKVVCREGHHKGECFFEVKSKAADTLKRKDLHTIPSPVSGAGDNRRVNGKTDPEKVRMAAEIRKLNQQLQAKTQADGGTSVGAPSNSHSAPAAAEGEADPEAEQEAVFLRLLHRDIRHAKEGLPAETNAWAREQLTEKLEALQGKLNEAKTRQAARRQQAMQPHELLKELGDKCKGFQKQLDDTGRALQRS